MSEALLLEILERVKRIEERQSASVVKETYTTEEAAGRLHKTEWTVRQWLNKGRARGRKVHGRGRQGEWRIDHDELVRLENEGPLPLPASRTAA